MDFEKPDSYSTRSLLFICEKNNIKLPQYPKREQMLQAIQAQQQLNVMKQKEIEIQKQRKSPYLQKREQISTPIIPLNLESACEGSFPTPIVMSRRVRSEMPDGSKYISTPIPRNAIISPDKPYASPFKPRSNSFEFKLIMIIGILLMIILFVFIIAML